MYVNMSRASTGELQDPTNLQAELDAVHQRLEHLEQFAFGGA